MKTKMLLSTFMLLLACCSGEATGSRNRSGDSSTNTALSKKIGWDEAVRTGPEMVFALAELSAASGRVDFNLDTSTLSDSRSFPHKRFRPAVLNLINKIHKSLGTIEGDIQKIRLRSLDIPSKVKKTMQFMRSSNPAMAKRFASIPLDEVKAAIRESKSANDNIKKHLRKWISLLKAFKKVLESTTVRFAMQGALAEREAEFKNDMVKIIEKEYRKAENDYNKSNRKLNRARKDYEQALNALSPGQKRRRYNGGEVDSNESADVDETEDTAVTTDKVDRLREKLNKAQKKYDEAFRRFQQYGEKLKDARVRQTELKFERGRIGSIEIILPKSITFASEATSRAQKFAEFFNSLDSVLVGRLSKSTDSFISAIDEITSKSNPRKSLVEDNSLRDRLILTATKTVNDSLVVNILTTSYGHVSNLYITDNLATIARLQTSDASQMERMLQERKSNLGSSKQKITRFIKRQAIRFPVASHKWQIEVKKYLHMLGVSQEAAKAQ